MDPTPPQLEAFKAELTTLLNKHSLDTATHTPDFILADFLLVVIAGFGIASRDTQTWLVS